MGSVSQAVSDIFLQCLHHEPDQHDEAELSRWIATWAPRIAGDPQALSGLMQYIFEAGDPENLPCLLLLSGCLEDADMTADAGGDNSILFETRSLLDAFRSSDTADAVTLETIDKIVGRFRASQ